MARVTAIIFYSALSDAVASVLKIYVFFYKFTSVALKSSLYFSEITVLICAIFFLM